jgi:hypothetical protein
MRKGIWQEFDGYDEIVAEIEAGRKLGADLCRAAGDHGGGSRGTFTGSQCPGQKRLNYMRNCGNMPDYEHKIDRPQLHLAVRRQSERSVV